MASETSPQGQLIDVHSHYIPDFLLSAYVAAGRTPALSGFPQWSPELALDAMTQSGIRTSILSVSTPGVHLGDHKEARRMARRCNEYCAQLKLDYPGRFGAFAALPLPDISGARDEIAYALDELKLEGIGLLASYGDVFLGSPELDPIMEELNARHAVVFVHPTAHPTSRTLKLEIPLWLLEYPIDTTRAAANLIMTGAMSRFPNIRMILAHGGGALPYLSWRLSAAPLIDHRYRHFSRQDILDAIGRFYFEIAQAPDNAAFGAMLEVGDPARILFGSDWPYCSATVTSAIEESFANVRSLSQAERHAIASGTASQLFPQLAG